MVLFSIANRLLLLGCALGCLTAYSQNLVKNPSFERYANCPKRLGNFHEDVQEWTSPTEGTTDYFNACSTAMGTPKNFNGVQPANFGQGYAGFYMYAPDDYREYLQAALSQALVKGRTYTISFYVSLAERSDFAVKEFGVLFSKDSLYVPIKKELSKGIWYQQQGNDYNYMEIGYADFYSDTQDWILVQKQFVAKGTERYMILGNFNDNARTRMFRMKRNAKRGAYYYLDFVQVRSLNGDDDLASVSGLGDSKGKDSYELEKTYIFENVLFAFDEAEILASEKAEVLKIFDYLDLEPSLQITITGHTDSVGSQAYNIGLSKKRAQAVADFLMHLGLPENRIFWSGAGGTEPVATNDTEEGRQQNRRVEFIIRERR